MAKIKINFNNIKDGKLFFYEKIENNDVIEFAYLTKDEDDITFKTEDGDIRNFPKAELNAFLIHLYNNITEEKVNQLSKSKSKNIKHNIDLKNKTSIPYFNLRMYGTNTPLFILFFVNMGLIGALKYFNIKYNITRTKQPGAHLKLKIKNKSGDIGYLNVYAKDIYQKYLLNGLKKEANKIFPLKEEDLNNTEILKKYFENYYSLKRFLNFKEAEHVFVDVTTKKILKIYDYPIEFFEIFGKFMPKKLLNDKVENIEKLDYQRIRMSESIAHLTYQVMQKAIIHMKNNKNQYNIKLDIDKSFIVKGLLASGMLQYTQTINPMEELILSTKITKTGVGNPKKDQITLQRRDLNKSYFGVISPSTTNEYGNIGLNQVLTNKTTIKDRFGTIMTKEFKDDINGFDILSASDSLSPFFEYDDTTRRIMGNQQYAQFAQIEHPDTPLIQTGMESIFPYLVSDRFAPKAKRNGKVVKIDDYIHLIYDNGEEDQYYIKDNRARTKRGVFLPLKYSVLVKPGQKVKKGQILASTSSLKKGKLAVGKNLVVALMGYRGMNYEDGWVAAESIQEKYTNTVYQKIIVPIDRISKVLKWNLKVGDNTEPGDILIEYTNSKDAEFEEDNESLAIGREIIGSKIRYHSPGGIIKDIKILINSEQVDKLILSKWKQEVSVLKKKLAICSKIKDDLKRADCKNNITNSDMMVVGSHKLFNEEFDGSIVEIYLEKDNIVKNGSKFSLLGSSGGKGTIQYTIPKGKEPVSEKTKLKIDFFPTPVSIFSRKNISIVLYIYAGKVIYFLNKRVHDLILSGQIKQAEKLLLETFSYLDKSKEQFVINSIKQFFTLPQKEIINYIKRHHPLENPAFPLIMPPFGNKFHMEDIQKAANHLKIPLNEKVMIPEEDGILTEQEVPVGIIPISYLEHFPQFMSGIRGSIKTKEQFASGQGRSGTKEGDGAVKLGTYDMFSISSQNATAMITELHVLKSDNPKAKNKLRNHILKTGESPSIEELGVLDEDILNMAKTKKMVDTYFIGAMLEPNL